METSVMMPFHLSAIFLTELAIDLNTMSLDVYLNTGTNLDRVN